MLDLHADRYYGLDSRQTIALSRAVKGWPRMACDVSIDTGSVRETAQYFFDRGLLTQDASRGKSAEPVVLSRVEQALYRWDPRSTPRISARDAVHMAGAVTRATISLRLRHLRHTVARIGRRKARKQIGASAEAMQDATSKFLALRPLFYTVGGRCLYDSVVLLEFLAARRLFPEWVIGITMVPFAAHSWVQFENAVLNDEPEFVRGFTPILAI
jgi:transglutaminase superfamily protein